MLPARPAGGTPAPQRAGYSREDCGAGGTPAPQRAGHSREDCGAGGLAVTAGDAQLAADAGIDFRWQLCE